MGAYAEHAERLIERGYAAIPIMAGTKKPGFFCAGMWIGLANWQRRFNSKVPPETERERWGAADSGLGVVAGAASSGMVAIDIDTDNPEIKTAILRVLPPTPVRKRGVRGETLFYHGPDITESRSWNIDAKRVVDLIGPGRQTVLPPTMHPGGVPYVWLGDESLEDIAPQELPALDAGVIERISAALASFGYSPPDEHASGPPGDAETPHRQLNEAALADLSAWVPALRLYRCRRTRLGYEAVPIWRPSTTGREPEKRHLNLKIVREGIRDFGADQGYTPLDLVMAADGCDLDTAFRFLNERLAWAPTTSPIVDIIDPETGEITGIAAAATSMSAGADEPTEPLEQYTHVPGAVGNIVDWITATARRPNRVLALGAAITIVGTLIGRRVAGPTQSATHLYVVPIGSTGAGKQHVLDSAIRLMHAAKAESHIGPSKFFSLSAVQALLTEKPLVLCVQDEIGVFLKSVTSRKASSHEAAVSQMLRTLWGISFAMVPTAQWAARKMNLISCPALSILGVSTPEEFYGALQGESINNGFLNRFLTLVSDGRGVEADPQLNPRAVPPALSDELNRLYLWSGPGSLLQIANSEMTFTPDILPWASQQAEGCYQDFIRMLECRMDTDPDSTPYIARCGEIGVRLATIRAAGRWGHGASVDLADMEWGAGISWSAGQSLAAKAVDYLPVNDRSEMTGKILALIRRRHHALKPRDIQMFIRGRLKSAEIKDILSQLVEAGEIEWTSDGYRPTDA